MKHVTQITCWTATEICSPKWSYYFTFKCSQGQEILHSWWLKCPIESREYKDITLTLILHLPVLKKDCSCPLQRGVYADVIHSDFRRVGFQLFLCPQHFLVSNCNSCMLCGVHPEQLWALSAGCATPRAEMLNSSQYQTALTLGRQHEPVFKKTRLAGNISEISICQTAYSHFPGLVASTNYTIYLGCSTFLKIGISWTIWQHLYLREVQFTGGGGNMPLFFF